ncbi:MAG: hypothetical protein KKG60_00450 [Nanoarchaeota archaeon]|nr:hypothetical protein [Nanoarchaeota archaeon]
MKLYELIAGFVAILVTIKIEDPIQKVISISAGILILTISYFSSNIEEIRRTLSTQSQEIKKLNEKVKIYKSLEEHNSRIKRVENLIENKNG